MNGYFKIMFRLFKQEFIVLSFSRSLATKFASLNDVPYLV